MYRSNPSTAQGFSLVEMAIVMVIIGLLVGGTLAGMNLMRAAEIRSIVEDQQRIVAAVNTFQDKYGSLPGDMYNATDIWGAAHATPATCMVTPSTDKKTCDGNGDGKINLNSTYNELFRFWQHLANAGLIEGYYTGVAGPGSTLQAIPGINVPMGKIAGTGWSAGVIEKDPPFAGYEGYFTGSKDYGNTLAFGQTYASAGGSGLTDEKILTPEEAMGFDQKLDDGKPGTGKIQTFTPVWHSCATSSNPAIAQYNTAYEDPACSLLFPKAF